MKTKKRKIGNFIALLVCFLLILFTGLLTVENFMPINNDENQSINLDITEALPSSFYDGLKGSGKVPTDAFTYVKDDTNKTIKITGFDFTKFGTNQIVDFPSAIGITDSGITVNYTVTEIDLTGNINVSPLSINSYWNNTKKMQAVIVPKSVLEIAEGSFWGFDSLVYFEAPFIGTERGSSTFGQSIGKISTPFVSMFKNVYYSTNQTNMNKGYVTTEVTDGSGYKTYPLDSNPTVEPIGASWYETNDSESEITLIPGTLKKIVITDETGIGNHALFNLGRINTSLDGTTITGYDGVESIEITTKSNSKFTFGEYALAENFNLRSVKLPSGEIGLSTGLLNKCVSLTSATIPNEKLTALPNGVFANCSSLEEVILPATIQTIATGAFNNCIQLKSMKTFASSPEGASNNGFDICLPASLTTIESDVFTNCVEIKAIFVPNSVKYIGAGAFSGLTSLETISLPFVGAHRGEAHSTICPEADKEKDQLFGYIFGSTAGINGTYKCAQGFDASNPAKTTTFFIPLKLTSIYITDETSIAYGAFSSLSSVKFITINDTLSSLTNEAFKDCSSLTELSIPFLDTNLKNIFGTGTNSDLFDTDNGCVPKSLKKVILTNDETITSGIFNNCTEIESVEIKDKTTWINGAIFYNNPHLKTLILPFAGCTRGERKSYWDSGHYHYIWGKDAAHQNSLMWLFSNSKHANTYANYTLGNENYYRSYIKYIPTSLENVTITNDTVITYYAFVRFSSLKSITIKTASSIAGGLMYGCSSIESLEVPFIGANSNPTASEGYAYVIGYYFGESEFTNTYKASQYRTYYIPNGLTTITLGNNNTTITRNAFANLTSVATISTNATVNSLLDYSFYNCKNLASLIIPNANYTSVGAYAFYGCSKLNNIDLFIPSTAVSLGNYSFAKTSISSIDLAKYSNVGAYAFSGCLNLTSVTIPTGIVINEGLFQDCQYLTSVVLNQKVLSKNLFKNCIMLTGIDIRGIYEIPEGAFSGCLSLQNNNGVNSEGLILEPSLRKIGAYAFYKCESLKEFYLSSTVTDIESYAFSGATGLENMTIPKETVNIGTNGWDNCDINFFFYAYLEEEDWPTTWSENWNCKYPVYVIGHVDETSFTYEYSQAYRGYFITGVKTGVTLKGFVTIPSRYQGLEVVGINSNGTEQLVSNQVEVQAYIIPASVINIKPGVFSTGNRIDLYFLNTEEKITSIYNSTDEHKDGWVPSSAVDFISKGVVFYKNCWSFGSDGKTPYVDISQATLELDQNYSYTYDGTAKTPEVKRIILPGYLKSGSSDGDYDYNVIDYINTDILSYSFKNNVAAGSATINASIRTVIYNDYINTILSAKETPIRLAGTLTQNFTIKKATITLFSCDFLTLANYTITTDYSNSKYTISDWDNTNVAGLPSNAVFTGTLSTYDKVARTYSYSSLIYGSDFNSNNGDFYFSSAWHVTRNGVDISKNYAIELYLDVVIKPLDVTIEFTNGITAADGTYQYRYTGERVVPYAKAINAKNGADVSSCKVICDTIGTGGIFPDSTTTFTGFAYLEDNKNYNLVVYDEASDSYLPINADIYNGVSRKALTIEFRIINGLVEININITYLIPTNVDYWSAAIDQDSSYISGLGKKTYFEGTLKSDSDDRATYAYGASTNKILWDNTLLKADGTYADFFIYKKDGSSINSEMDYYDISIKAFVTIQYNTFVMDYFIANTSTDPMTIEKSYISYSPTLVNERYFINLDFETQGEGYLLYGKPSNCPTAKVTYPSEAGYTVSDNGLEFTKPGPYRFGICSEARHFETFLGVIEINVIKSSYQLTNPLEREYNRKPIDIFEDGLILKYEHVDPSVNIEIKYYSDRAGLNEISAPTNVGTYYTHITANETAYFNSFDSGIKEFKITKRKILINIGFSKDYDGSNIIPIPTNNELIDSGYILNADDAVPYDEFVGVLHTSSAAPGIYTTENIMWNPVWGVYNSLLGDVTSNYTVVINGTFEIKYLEFEYTVEDYIDEYDGLFHSGTINVTKPLTGYQIHYSTSQIYYDTDISSLSTFIQSRSEIGEYEIYFVLTMDNYRTIYDSYKITINPLQIVYYEYNGSTDSSHQYTEYYNGLLQKYAVTIDSPWNAVAYYSYNGEDYTLNEYEFSEVGIYTISYRIEAEHYETVTGTVQFIISDNSTPLPDTFGVINTQYQYNGLDHETGSLEPHSIQIKYPSEAASTMHIYYSLDNIEFFDTNFKFTEVGSYTIYVKFAVPNYQTTTTFGIVNIYALKFPTDFAIDNYSGVFDGAKHTATLSGTGITSSLDENDLPEYYYSGEKLTISYTSNVNNVNAGYGFDSYVGYSNVGTYYVWMMVALDNYETIILGNGRDIGQIVITPLTNPTGRIEYQEFEYSLYSSAQLEIDTIHDGIKTYYYYLATYDDASGTYSCDFTNRTTLPEELGYYYVRVVFNPTGNVTMMKIDPLNSENNAYLKPTKEASDNFIRIIPKVVKVSWNETVIYDGLVHSPNPIGDTGTSDSIYINYVQTDPIGVDPIEAGIYIFELNMLATNPNYVLDRTTITMEIKKIKLEITIEESVEANYDETTRQAIPWTKDSGWDLLGLPLLSGHKLTASMKTSSGTVAYYFYMGDGVTSTEFTNMVNILSWDIVDNDGNSVKNFYDVYFNITINITNPKLDLSKLTDTEITYDGLPHIPSPNLGVGLNGAIVQYLDRTTGKYSSVPEQNILAGEYSYDIRVSKTGFETTEGSIKLIINKADLDIEIADIDDPTTTTDDDYKIYSATEKFTTYFVKNVSDSNELYKANGNETHILYYPASSVSKEDLQKFYDNFSTSNKIYSYGLEKMVNAGVYYCVVYFEDTANMWNASYQIKDIEILRKDIRVDILTNFNYLDEYNGKKVSIPLGNAVFTMSDLLPKHTINEALITTFTVRTNSANAGIYNPKTDFEFAVMQILNEYSENVATNYRPVLSDNIRVEITKTYLSADTFEVEALEKEYDGLPNNPTVNTLSDGEKNYTYYIYNDGDLLSTPVLITGATPTYVGSYYVVVSISEGTNFYSSSVGRPGQAPIGDLGANVIVTPKNQEITWEDIEVEFDGKMQVPTASFKDIFDVPYKLEVFFINEDGSEYSSIVRAGSYEAYARFPSADEEFGKNFILTNPTSSYYMSKKSYTINIGDNTADNSASIWMKDLTVSMIADFPDTLSITNNGGAKATVSTLTNDPGYYYDNSSFSVNANISYIDGNIDVTDSIEFIVKGSVTIIATNIVFIATDKKVNYATGYAYSISNLKALQVTIPTTNYHITYKVEGVDDNYSATEPTFTNVGTYTIEFVINAEGYSPATGTVTITITQMQSYITINKTLNKTYDGIPQDVASIVASSSVSGFNGVSSALVYTYYVKDIYGNYTLLDDSDAAAPGNDRPIDAGSYRVNIINSDDYNPGVVLNYTPLNLSFDFVISPKNLDVVIKLDKTVSSNSDLGINYTYTINDIEASNISGLPSGEKLSYEITNSNIQRNTFTYKGTLAYNESIVGVSSNEFTANTAKTNIGSNVFNISWYITSGSRSEADSDGNEIPMKLSSNYNLIIDFSLYVHYKDMQLTIAGVTHDYDGNAYHGSVDFVEPIAANITQYYSTTKAIDPNNSDSKSGTVSEINDASVSRTNPGTTTVYYLFVADNYEEKFGSFEIKISYIDRNIDVTIPTKTYDTNPIFTKPSGSDYYLPSFSNTLADTNVGGKVYPTEDYDISKVTIVYHLKGSELAIDSTKGAILAGTYSYTLIIPASTYYSETAISGEFTIAKRELVIKDDPNNLVVKDYNGTSTSYNIQNNTNFIISYKNDDGSLASLPSDLSLSGFLITNSYVAKKYTGTDASLLWYNNTYSVNSNEDDVTSNYILNIQEASITISKIDISTNIADTYLFNYTGSAVNLNGLFSVFYPLTWEISYYNNINEEWISGYEEFILAGTYTTKIRITSANYNDFEKVVGIEIGPGEPNMEIISKLSQDYNGLEVVLPENITSHPESLDYTNYIYKYYQFDSSGRQEFICETVWNGSAFVNNVYSGTGRPINAGKYLIEVEVPASTNYKGIVLSQEFEIYAKQIKASWTNTSFVYDGMPKTPTVSFDFADKDTSIGLSYSYVEYKSDGTQTTSTLHSDVATYDVTVILDPAYNTGNYSIDTTSNVCRFSITRRTVTISLNANKSYGSAVYSFNYSAGATTGSNYFTANNLGSNHKITSILNLNETSVGIYTNISSFNWTSATNDCYIVDNTTNADVTNNYIIKYSLNLKINYGTVEFSAPVVETVYDGMPHSVTVTVDTLGNFEVRYSTTPGLSESDFTLATSPQFIDVKANPSTNPITIEPYFVYFVIIDKTGGYATQMGSSSVTITPAPAEMEIKDPTGNPKLDKIYDGTAVVNPEVIYNTSGGDVLTYKYSKYMVDSLGNVVYAPISYNPYLAGKYKLDIVVTTSGSYNYTGGSLSYEFEISKRELTIYYGSVTKYYDLAVWELDLTTIGLLGLALNENVNYGTIATRSSDVGEYISASDFIFRNALCINNTTDSTDRASNYNLNIQLNVTILESTINASATDYIGVYDGDPHSIGVPVLSDTVMTDGKVIPAPAGYKISYSTTRDGLYSESPVTRTNVGAQTVYYKIEADNYTTFYGEASITITGISIPGGDIDDPDFPPGPSFSVITNPNDPEYDPTDPRLDPDYDSDGDGIYLSYVKNYVYNGSPYNPTPHYNCPSSGAQTVTYYTASDYAGSKSNPMTSVTNAGDYVMVVDIATDGVYEAIQVTQAFGIYKASTAVIWDNLSFEFGTTFSMTARSATSISAYYKNINNNNVNAVVNIDSIIDSNGLIPVGEYAVTATTPDTNYLLTNENETLIITRCKITEPVIRTDLTVEFLSELEIFDSDGNKYVIDEFGVITSIIHPDGSKTENPNLPYTIILDVDKNADGVVVEVHKLTIQLNTTDSLGYSIDDNYEWEVLGSIDDIVIDYSITPIEIPHSIYNLEFNYKYQWIWDDSYLPSLEPSLIIELVNSSTGEKIELVQKTMNSEGVLSSGDYVVTYSNNTGVPSDGSLSEMLITGVDNYQFSTVKYFQILAQTPNVLTLKDDAFIQFITADYDEESETASFVEDETVPVRTFESKTEHNFYLGHLHQETFISDILDQFAHDSSSLNVYDASGTLVDSSLYSGTYFGTGYKICLLDDHGIEIDSINSIIFGDLDGDGLINYIDSNSILNIITGLEGIKDSTNASYTKIEKYRYFASYTSRSEAIITYSFSNSVLNFISSGIDFNDMFAF